MKFALTQKISTYALAIVAAFPLFASGEVGYSWVALSLLLGVAGWWFEPPLTSNKKFRRAITITVLVVLALQIGRAATTEPIVKMGMEFAAFLLGIKFLTRGFASDYSQIVILSFMHIIAATIAVDDISYAVSFLLFAGLSPPVLALAYLRKEMEHRFGEDKARGSKSMLERLLNSKRVVSHKFLLGSSLLSLPILLITAVLFITFPRMGFGFFGRLGDDTTTAGFGTEVTLGDLDITRMDETVLLRLEPFKFKGKLPEYLPIKIRGAVFDIYEGNIWKRSQTPKWRVIKNESDFHKLDQNATIYSGTPGFNILLESINPPLIFLPEGTGVIETYPKVVGGRPLPRILKKNAFGSVRYNNQAKVGLQYKTYLTDLPPHGTPPNDVLSYSKIPEGNERLIALAKEFAGNGPPKERVKNLINSLKTKYKYSLMLSGSEANELADNPLDRFLFTRRTGTCEHFATALTLMLRAVGLQSRLVTGFSAAEWNSIGEYYAVRSRFAHSWTEVFLEDRWVTVDATPPNFGQQEQRTLSSFALFIDTVRMQWHKRIVGYDASTQFDIAMGLWKFYRKHKLPDKSNWTFVWWPVFTLLGLVAVAAAIYWIRKRRQNALQGPKKKRLKREEKEASKLYIKLERKLDNRGHGRPKSRTPLEHANSLLLDGLEIAEDAKQIITRYNEIRFGASQFKPGELSALNAKIRHL